MLSIAVLQVVAVAVVPGDPDPQQRGRQEAVLGQDHKVGEEPGQGLDHTWRAQGEGGLEPTTHDGRDEPYVCELTY